MKALDIAAIALLVVGGLNWGLVGSMNFDLVAALFGHGTALANVVYVAVGLAALYEAVSVWSFQRRWTMA